MSTPTNATNDACRRLGHVALGLGTLLAAGCATAPFKPLFPDSGAYTFTITFVKGCPVSADVDYRNCDASGRGDCVRVRQGETVVFVASPQTTPPLQFELQFDPFKNGLIRSENGRKSLKIDAPANPDKGYTFNVLSGACRPLDPWIIVQ